jgi:predicted ribosomally synthesized peptide with SipW-like signal peptide
MGRTWVDSVSAVAVVDMPRRALRRLVGRPFVALVLVLSVGGATAGTWASFSAATSNNATFTTGTLILSNDVDGDVATACFSTAAGQDIDGNDRACDALFPTAIHKPGDAATFADVHIRNEGDLAGILETHMASCTNSDAGNGEQFHGTGLACSAVQFTIQENVAGNWTCVYGGTACAFDPTKTIADFVAAHGSFGAGLDLGALAAGTTRDFRVGVQLPGSAGNDMQGRAAVFGLVWRLVQS